jgi:hypothetical protein
MRLFCRELQSWGAIAWPVHLAKAASLASLRGIKLLN